MKNTILLLLLTFSMMLTQGCKKEEEAEIPPTLELKTGAGYTSADATVAKGATVKIGITAKKTEDDLKSFNLSYAFDGGTATTSKQTIDIPAASKTQYDLDVTIVTRNQAGSEKWYFTITDVDGNIVQKTVTLTVK